MDPKPNALKYAYIDDFIQARRDAMTQEEHKNMCSAEQTIIEAVWGLHWAGMWAKKTSLLVNGLKELVAEDSDEKLAACVRNLLVALEEPIEV